jgi:hypothetical protein
MTLVYFCKDQIKHTLKSQIKIMFSKTIDLHIISKLYNSVLHVTRQIFTHEKV